LGSSSYVTDIDGLVFQHIEYFPFGETWVEEHSNRQRTPYLFTGKELDEDTQLYYYGARYYDPRTSVWQSADPLLYELFNGGGSGEGIYDPAKFALYSYTRQNPVGLVDPVGKDWQWPDLFMSQQESDAWHAERADYYYNLADQVNPTSFVGKVYEGIFERRAMFTGLGDEHAVRIGLSREDRLGETIRYAPEFILTGAAGRLAMGSRAGATTTVKRTGAVGVVAGRHNANVLVRDVNGNIVTHSRLVSGNQTVSEQALGFPRGMLASHTEARAVTSIPLRQGDTMIITGQMRPCPSCKGYMNRAAQEQGATIRYQWRENGGTQVWTARPGVE